MREVLSTLGVPFTRSHEAAREPAPPTGAWAGDHERTGRSKHEASIRGHTRGEPESYRVGRARGACGGRGAPGSNSRRSYRTAPGVDATPSRKQLMEAARTLDVRGARREQGRARRCDRWKRIDGRPRPRADSHSTDGERSRSLPAPAGTRDHQQATRTRVQFIPCALPPGSRRVSDVDMCHAAKPVCAVHRSAKSSPSGGGPRQRRGQSARWRVAV